MLALSTLSDDVVLTDIKQTLGETEHEFGVELFCHEVPIEPTGHELDYETGERWHFTGHVREQLGVLAQITELFAENNLNIDEVLTAVVGNPPLCTIDLDVLVTDDVPFSAICAQYVDLAARLGFVKADMAPVTGRVGE